MSAFPAWSLLRSALNALILLLCYACTDAFVFVVFNESIGLSIGLSDFRSPYLRNWKSGLPVDVSFDERSIRMNFLCSGNPSSVMKISFS